jgi:thiosulfate reductase cytochrome b subunit
MSEQKLYLYPIWIRLWHLANALMCLTLIVTGLSMQFSGPRVSMVRFDTAVAIHNIAGIVLTASYIIFFAGNLFMLNGKYYQMEFHGLFTRLKKQFMYYTFGIFKNEKPPFPVNLESKFNPLQQFSYVFIMYLFVPLVFITGWGLLYPATIPTVIFGGSGLHTIDFLHILAGFIISVFMVIHIYFCTIGKTPVSNFKSIINGYHEDHD